MLATAKSCTGGLIAAACTEVSGSSDWFERGFLTCSNAAKTELLGVPAALIYKVSEPVARAMAAGALLHSRAHFSVAVTGVAGPNGGSADKPVGTWLAWATHKGLNAERHQFPGPAAVCQATVVQAVADLLERLRLWDDGADSASGKA